MRSTCFETSRVNICLFYALYTTRRSYMRILNDPYRSRYRYDRSQPVQRTIMENPGIDPGTSRMQSERSTIWASSPCPTNGACLSPTTFWVLSCCLCRWRSGVFSRVAQRKRAGPITQRSVDRNHPLLRRHSRLHITRLGCWTVSVLFAGSICFAYAHR